MKKIYLTLSLGAFMAANAQLQIVQQVTANPVNKAVLMPNLAIANVAASSTLTPSTFTGSGCATSPANLVFYSSFGPVQATGNFTVQSKGYSFGTNLTTYTLSAAFAGSLGTPTITTEINRAAEKYSVTGTASVTKVIMSSAKRNGTGMISAKIYSENAVTKAPSAQIGTAATLALSTLTGTDVFTFGTPVPLPAGNFFVSVETPPMGGAGKDTLAIFSTVLGCATSDSLSWIYSQVTPANPAISSGWSSVKTAFGGTTADNLDFLIFPVIDIATGLNNSVSKGNLTLLTAYPNPATSEVSINFGLKESSKVEIEIYDITGKMINTIKLDALEGGNHTSKINVSNLNAGVYMYSVKSETTKMFSKFTVAK